MLRNALVIIVLSFLSVHPAAPLFAGVEQPVSDQTMDLPGAGGELQKADLLLAKGDMEDIEQALSIYKKFADQTPNSYPANWKCAKAHYLYAELVRRSGSDDWKEVCKNYGKSGYLYGEKAIALAPDQIEGNLYYGLCVWKYSDGVSIARALAEGLKGSTQSAFEKSYLLDRMYDNGWPMKALGRFWHQLPWPLRDYEDSRKFLEEHHKYFPEDPQGLVFLSETLIDLKDKNRARGFLEKAAAGNQDPYYSRKAKALLADNY